MEFIAATRTITGKKVKQLRRDKHIPAVLYGHGLETRSISIDENIVRALIRQVAETGLIDLNLDGKQIKVLIKQSQRHPISGDIIHIDFQEVSMKEKIKTTVPIIIEGEAPAVKELGAVLVKPIDRIEISCLPQDLISEYILDISKLAQIGDVIRVSDLEIPSTIQVLTKPDTVIVITEEPRKEEEIVPTAEEEQPDLESIMTEKEEKEAKDKGEGIEETEAKSEEKTEAKKKD